MIFLFQMCWELCEHEICYPLRSSISLHPRRLRRNYKQESIKIFQIHAYMSLFIHLLVYVFAVSVGMRYKKVSTKVFNFQTFTLSRIHTICKDELAIYFYWSKVYQ